MNTYSREGKKKKPVEHQIKKEVHGEDEEKWTATIHEEIENDAEKKP